jgi:hypothetical protein
MSLRSFREQYPLLVDHLLLARRGGRVAHGYLIAGDNADRVSDFAEAWLAANACRTPVDGDACGGCDACRRMAAGTYPNRQDLRPASKARQIRIDEIRELEQFLSHRSDGTLRIGAIYDADCMNESAQNAFLKTLEEPASDTLLVLVTTRPARLLTTIRSRCQTLTLHDNRVTYDFPELPDLRDVLSGAARGAGAAVGKRVSGALSALLSGLKATAEKDAAAKFEARHGSEYELPPAQKKRLADQAKAAGAAAYLARRDAVLSAVHTYFAQRFLLSSGVAFAELANPELFGEPPEALPCANTALAELECVERLLADLRFNVDESLAVAACFQNLTKK